MTAALKLVSLEAGYGPVAAIKGISLEVCRGQVTALLGANGAGKTTTMLAISGLLKIRQGEIQLDGETIGRLKNDDLVRLGIVQVPQGRQIFSQMTVQENIELGAFLRAKSEIPAALDDVLTQFPRLAERRSQVAGTLSGGEQQMVAIARALMANPRVLLLDEPSLGLAPIIVDTVYETIERMKGRGLAILLAEQNVEMALSVANSVCLLQNGVVLASGNVEEMKSHGFIASAYLT